MKWYQAIETVKPHVVKIFTPDGSGTGFLVSYHGKNKLCGIATAAHVIHHAHFWENPIRVRHHTSGQVALFRNTERAVFIDTQKDAALILIGPGNLPLPAEPLPLMVEGQRAKLGVELGWLGFPAVASEDLCFFSGRVSSWLEGGGYLIDGVAINGVSGGPTIFIRDDKEINLAGIVSAYIPNRATGDTLPGLCVVRDVKHFQTLIKQFKTIDEAKEQETPPTPAIDVPILPKQDSVPQPENKMKG